MAFPNGKRRVRPRDAAHVSFWEHSIDIAGDGISELQCLHEARTAQWRDAPPKTALGIIDFFVRRDSTNHHNNEVYSSLATRLHLN